MLFAACASSAVSPPLANRAPAEHGIRTSRAGEFGARSETCATRGAYRPDLAPRVRAFAETTLASSSRIVSEKVTDLPSMATLSEAAVNLRSDEVALVFEPREVLGILWVVHKHFESIYCVHLLGDVIVLEPTITRITGTTP